ncbi:MAG: SpoIVB peptidase S55 domain-containing protein, partial [Candidatus Angelobacter sp.]
MKKAVTSLALFVFLGLGLPRVYASDSPASSPKATGPQIMRVDEVHPGMKGVAYTVFQGTQPEPMKVEVLGVLKNFNGPKADVVLIRLTGDKPEYTGVVAGMSGSPVYIDGKLLGAIAYRIGQFSKEAIAGVTPIQQMLEISELDHSVPESAVAAARPVQAEKTGGPGVADTSQLQGMKQLLQPIDSPFVFSGFTAAGLQPFASQLTAAGITPVMGVGSVSDEKQPEPLVPGSAVSAVLVRGDMDVAATCTVTYMDKDHLLACGHPLTQYGMVDMPMTKANV